MSVRKKTALNDTTVTFPIGTDDKSMLAAVAERKGLTMSALIRMVLKDYLNGEGER